MGTGAERPMRRGRGRPRKIVTEDETSGASASNPLAEDVDMGQILEPQVHTSIPEFVNPPQPQGQMPDFSNWVGMISQAVMSLAMGPSAPTRGPESEMVVERAQRLGAQNFHGTSDPSEADDWFQGMEGVFEAMHSTEEDKLRIATYMLRGGARDWW